MDSEMIEIILTAMPESYELKFAIFWHRRKDDFHHLTVRHGPTHLMSVWVASPQRAIGSLNPCEFKQVICIHVSNDLRFIQRPMQMRRDQIKGADKFLEGHC